MMMPAGPAFITPGGVLVQGRQLSRIEYMALATRIDALDTDAIGTLRTNANTDRADAIIRIICDTIFPPPPDPKWLMFVCRPKSVAEHVLSMPQRQRLAVIQEMLTGQFNGSPFTGY